MVIRINYSHVLTKRQVCTHLICDSELIAAEFGRGEHIISTIATYKKPIE